jgi:mannan endo-1,4-beta-mannosidase
MRTRKSLRKAAHAIAPLLIGAIVMLLFNGTGNDAVANASPVPVITGPSGAAPVNMFAIRQVKKPSAASSSRAHGPLFGIFQPEVPWKARITKAITRSLHPKIVQVYSRFGAKFRIRAARINHYNGALTLFQFDPRHVSLRRIATGHYDRYLRHYARSVTRLRFKIAISFAHEMNGNWYSWGYNHAGGGPRTFVKAWRRIHRIFAQMHVKNVLWVWTINKLYLNNSKLIVRVTRADWPGKAFVNWVGIDGYFRFARWTFAKVFAPTIHLVKKITNKPIILTETAVTVKRRSAQLREIFAGVKKNKLHGFIYFDANARSKWSLHGYSITLVRKLLVSYGYTHSTVP